MILREWLLSTIYDNLSLTNSTIFTADTILRCALAGQIKDLVHREFVPLGPTVNQQFYLNVLKWMSDSLQWKCPEQWQHGDWFLHHDNAPLTTQTWASTSFWLKPKWWSCSTTPTCLTLLLVTIFCTHGWSRIGKGGILLTLQRSNENQWWPLTELSLQDFR